MIRLLHVLALTVLVGSAAYAYSVKYETLYYAETLTKMKAKVQKEREAIAVARAEWALLTRPDRLQAMLDKHSDLQPMTIGQLARLSDIPARPARNDEIGRKLEALGVDPAPAPQTARRPEVPQARREAKSEPVIRKDEGPGRRDEIARKLDELETTSSITPKRAGHPGAPARPAAR